MHLVRLVVFSSFLQFFHSPYARGFFAVSLNCGKATLIHVCIDTNSRQNYYKQPSKQTATAVPVYVG